MPLFKVSLENCIIKAKTKEQAIQGFANYCQEIDNSCFKVEPVTDPNIEEDWTA